MKSILIAVASAFCIVPILSAAPGDSPFGSRLIDDILTPYDDTAVELPGEDARKPSVSRSAQLVDDSAVDTWGTREDDGHSSASAGKTPSSDKSSSPDSTTKTETSSGDSRFAGNPSRRDASDNEPARTVYDLDENNPFKNNYRYKDTERKPTGSAHTGGSSSRDTSDYEPGRTVYDLDENNPFKNNYRYKDTERRSTGSAQSGIDEVHDRIKDILKDSAPKQGTALDMMDELMHSAGREAARERPATPDRWNRAPNGWFCDFDDAMEKAQLSGKAIAVFFHSSDSNNSRRFKSERMENSKFKNKMHDRLIVVYLDFPDNADTHKDRRNRDQVEHNRRIAEQFHVSDYPTLIFLDSSGTEIGRTSELKNSVSAFVDNADRIVPQREAKPKDQNGFKIGGSLDDMKLSGDSSRN